MDVIVVILGLGWGATVVWAAVVYLFQMIKIEELEAKLQECRIKKFRR